MHLRIKRKHGPVFSSWWKPLLTNRHPLFLQEISPLSYLHSSPHGNLSKNSCSLFYWDYFTKLTYSTLHSHPVCRRIPTVEALQRNWWFVLYNPFCMFFIHWNVESYCVKQFQEHPFLNKYDYSGINLASYFTDAGSPLATLGNLSGTFSV